MISNCGSRPLQLSVSIETLALVFFFSGNVDLDLDVVFTVDIADLFQKPDPISCFVYFYQS